MADNSTALPNETQFTNADIEQRLGNLLLQLTRGQVGQFNTQQTQQQDIFGQLLSQLDSLNAAQTPQINQALGGQDQFAAINSAEQQRILGGGAPTDADRTLINDATNAAIASGTQSIQDYATQQLQDVRDILAPSRGLRPSDSPILDAGNRIGQAATQQVGQLTKALQANAANTLLTYPLQRDAQLSSMAQFQAGLQQSQQNFASQLQQQAFANRATLAQLQTGAGLNLLGNTASGANALSTLSGNALGLQQLQQQNSQFQQSQPGFWQQLGSLGGTGGIGSIIGGAGGFISGLGSLF